MSESEWEAQQTLHTQALISIQTEKKNFVESTSNYTDEIKDSRWNLLRHETHVFDKNDFFEWHNKTYEMQYQFYNDYIHKFKACDIQSFQMIEKWINDENIILNKDRNINVLEIGCGVGNYGMLLKNELNNINFVGIDISPKAIEIMKEFNNDQYYNNILIGDIMDNEYIQKLEEFNGFDLIISNLALFSDSQVLPGHETCFKMFNLLNNNGYFVVCGDYYGSEFAVKYAYDMELKDYLIKNKIKLIQEENRQFAKPESENQEEAIKQISDPFGAYWIRLYHKQS